MDNKQVPLDTQTATSHGDSLRHVPPVQQESDHDDQPLSQSVPHEAESESTHSLHERVKARNIYRRGEVLRLKAALFVQDGGLVQLSLANHIYKSLPCYLLANPTTVRKCMFSVHDAVSRIALRQAVKSARRLDLKRVVDTKGFVSDHCYWYRTFCSLFDAACRSVGLKPINGEIQL